MNEIGIAFCIAAAGLIGFVAGWIVGRDGRR